MILRILRMLIGWDACMHACVHSWKVSRSGQVRSGLAVLWLWLWLLALVFGFGFGFVLIFGA